MPFTQRTHHLHGGSRPPDHHFQYTPQEDVEPYELALVLPVLIAAWGKANGHGVLGRRLPSWLNDSVEELPEPARRHFVRHDGHMGMM